MKKLFILTALSLILLTTGQKTYTKSSFIQFIKDRLAYIPKTNKEKIAVMTKGAAIGLATGLATTIGVINLNEACKYSHPSKLPLMTIVYPIAYTSSLLTSGPFGCAGLLTSDIILRTILKLGSFLSLG